MLNKKMLGIPVALILFLVASLMITPMGGTSEALATSATLGNGAAGDLLSGKTATVDAGQITGTMTDRTGSGVAITPSTTDQAFPQGYYSGGVTDGKVLGDANLVSANIKAGTSIFGVAGKSSVVDTSDATATSGQLTSGVTAYVNGTKLTGSMANRSGGSYANLSWQNVGGSIQCTPPAGYWDGNTNVGVADSNLVASNIISGVSIFGVAGTAINGTGLKKFASGTVTSSSNSTITVTGLDFRPNIVLILQSDVQSMEYGGSQGSVIILTDFTTMVNSNGGYFAAYGMNGGINANYYQAGYYTSNPINNNGFIASSQNHGAIPPNRTFKYFAYGT